MNKDDKNEIDALKLRIAELEDEVRRVRRAKYLRFRLYKEDFISLMDRMKQENTEYQSFNVALPMRFEITSGDTIEIHKDEYGGMGLLDFLSMME